MTVHRLKVWPEQFQALADGRKHHEVRKTDRNYQVGDVLFLMEFEPIDAGDQVLGAPSLGRYTGRTLERHVTWITAADTFGLPADVCVMSLTWAPGRMSVQVGISDQ